MAATKTIKFMSEKKQTPLLISFQDCTLIVFLLPLSTFSKCSFLYQMNLGVLNQRLEKTKAFFPFWYKGPQISDASQ